MNSFMNHETQIRDIDEELEEIEYVEDLKKCEDFMNSEENTILSDDMNREPGKLLYRSASGKFYIKVFERRIMGHGYYGELRHRNARDFDIAIGNIRRVLAFDENLEIRGERFVYIVPNLNHVEMVDYKVCLIVAQYFERVKYRHENN